MADIAPPAKKQRVAARIAVVGAGSWAQGWHLPHLQCNICAEIAAIVDPCTTTVDGYAPNMKPPKDVAEHYGVPLFTHIDDFLKSEVAASVHGVIVCTPHHTHFDVGMKVLQAKMHVLMEKPMTTDVAQARQMAEAASLAGKTFMVNTSANFRSQSIQARYMVKNGKVGEVEHVACYMMRERKFLDTTTLSSWTKPHETMLGNGMAWGQLSHTLSWVLFVTGLSPSTVSCQMVFSKNTGADLYDSATIKCDNGAVINVQGVASIPGSNSVLDDSSGGKLIENKIFGTEGCLFYSGDDARPSSGSLLLRRHDGENTKVEGFYFENTLTDGDGPESLHAFIDGCQGNSFVNASDAILGVKVVQALEAMYRSAKSGRVENVL